MRRVGLLSLLFTTLTFGITAWAQDPISIASFNVKFIGFYADKRDNEGLARLMSQFDIVVVQELVSPPFDGQFPDGRPYRPDPESRAFFDAMMAEGFRFVLSEEDTGPVGTNGNNGSATEWYVAFYRSNRVCATGDPHNGAVCEVPDLPNGFLDADRTNHQIYRRVPYAFGFGVPGAADFVLVSVHLPPSNSAAARAARRSEMREIVRWIGRQRSSQAEQDFIILGDMNVERCNELDSLLPAGFTALNDECRDTTTALSSKPFDHVFVLDESMDFVDRQFDIEVIDLVNAMRSRWSGPGAYPGDPYKARVFPQFYSDHHPVHFQLVTAPDDD